MESAVDSDNALLGKRVHLYIVSDFLGTLRSVFDLSPINKGKRAYVLIDKPSDIDVEPADELNQMKMYVYKSG